MAGLLDEGRLLKDLARISFHKKQLHDIWEYKWRDTLRIRLRKHAWDSGVVIENWWFKVYSRSLKGLRPTAVVIDIGAHIGTFTLLAAKTAPQAKIYSFEPCSQNYSLLKDNIALNDFTGNVHLFKTAVSEKSDDTLALKFDPFNAGRSHISVSTNMCVEKVSTISLDDVFIRNDIEYCDLLKVDCEGHEEVIFNSVSAGTLQKIGRICMEYHPGVDIQKIISILKGAGFSVRTDSLLRVPVLKKLVNVPLLYAYRTR